VFTAIYKTFCNLQDVVSPYGTVNTTQKVYRVETGLFTFTNYRVRLPVKEYDEVCSQLTCLKLLLQMLPDKPDEMMPVKVTLAESLNHISKATSYVQFGDRLIYRGKVYEGEEKEEGTKQLNPYQKKLNEAKASYNSATDTWQSILDKYNVSYSEIGLTEPLTKIE